MTGPRRRVPFGLGALLASAWIACGAPSALDEPATPAPNLVLVLADDMGFGEWSRREHPYVHTPQLLALAADGVELSGFRAAAPVCSPTRASLLTGRHPVRTGTYQWGHELPADERTLAEALAEQGYATGLFGKWHLGSVRAGAPTSPGAQGFETWAAHPNFFENDPSFSVGGEVVAFSGASSAVCVERALAFAAEAVDAERPFFAFVSLGSPHVPHVASAEDLAALQHVPEAMRAYVAELQGVDAAVGRLRAGLAELGVAGDTVVWFTSDNGPRPPDDAPASTAGLRGRKGTLWEGGLRVPSVVAWPGVLPAGAELADATGSVDVAPTLLDLARLAPNLGGGALDGVSLADDLRVPEAPTRPRSYGFWHVDTLGRVQHGDRILEALAAGEVHAEEAPRDLTDLRARLVSGERPGPAAWVEGSLKLHARRGADGEPVVELYDLARDPTESTDLAARRPADVQRLLARLRAWQTEAVLDEVTP